MTEGPFTVRVYYEDTDAGGVVYHANYLRFMERARTELLAKHGVSVAEFHRKGQFLTVAHVDIDFRRPAFLGEILEITTEQHELRNASMTVRQRVLRADELIAEAHLRIACVDRSGKPIRLPDDMRKAFENS